MPEQKVQGSIDFEKTKDLFSKVIIKAKAMLESMPFEMIEEYAEKDFYLRVSSSGYTPLSLEKEYPLSGYSKGPIEDLEKAKACFSGLPEAPGNGKDEHRVQATIIKCAILKSLKIKGDDFDELFFAYDELPFVNADGTQTKRLDLLCVAKKGTELLPVLLELKGPRVNICVDDKEGYTGVVSQLNEYSGYLVDDRLKGSVRELLEVKTGYSVDVSKMLKVAIFPEYSRQSRGAGDMIKTFRKQNVLALEYPKKGGLRLYKVKTGFLDSEYS